MIILGIETSCDETAAAILKDGAVLSSIVSTQWLHAKYGGVVPELASRAHLRLLAPILNQTLEDAEITLEEVDAVAVTKGPGLIGALLVGISTAKALAYARNVPVIGVNHLEGHLWSSIFEDENLETPFLALLVSGGHTMLVGVEGFNQYQMIGQTRDDAAGEAFDKVAVLCGLHYPGGAQIEKIAEKGDLSYHSFPVSMRGQSGYEFSFAGLKTAVANFLRHNPSALEEHLPDVLACFQEAVVSSLVEPTCRAMDDFGYRDLVLSGGVAANTRLRQRLHDEVSKRGGRFHSPGIEYCTDNATMIAWVGWRRLQSGECDDFDLTGHANLPLPGIIDSSTAE
jgi:N6-L-threonylcarbamoyladenine synthase